jgi:hypothetical protein
MRSAASQLAGSAGAHRDDDRDGAGVRVAGAVVGGDGAASQLAGRAVPIGMTIAMPPEFE